MQVVYLLQSLTDNLETLKIPFFLDAPCFCNYCSLAEYCILVEIPIIPKYLSKVYCTIIYYVLRDFEFEKK